MKPVLITVAFLTIFSSLSKGQNPDTTLKTTATSVKFDKPPVPPQGAMMAFYQYLSGNIRYPAAAFENRIQGKLLLSFSIEANGSVTNVIESKGLSKETDAEVIRVMSDCPKWTPASKNGQPVGCRITVPVTFTISGNTASVVAGRW